MSRRAALGALTVAAAGLGVGAAYARSIGKTSERAAQTPTPAPPQIARPRSRPIAAENALEGSRGWQIDGRRPVNDRSAAIKGYASHTSAAAGDRLSFYVSVADRESFGIELYRIGDYRGAGGRLVHHSPTLQGVRQAAPLVDSESGLISCGWEAVWTVTVPETWISGYYLAVFTTESGSRSYTAFVIRDLRSADFCVVVPFATYQAYNTWPFDGSTGRNFYGGFNVTARQPLTAPLVYKLRARKVAFDRPFENTGLPMVADLDMGVARWAEAAGYDVTYAASDDLHAGRIDPSRYRGLVFSGHDEYWTQEMRTHTERAVAGGTSLAFLSANNVYWRIRYGAAVEGTSTENTANRVIACYKTDPDPQGGPNAATLRWRDAGANPAQPEETLIGVMYNGVVKFPVPLVVRQARHWLWAGTGVRNGDRIPGVVAGEADGFTNTRLAPPGNLTLLAASRYELKTAPVMQTQNTSFVESPSGAVIFAAGSMLYPRTLSDPRISRLTANVLDRIISH